jgi:hypothetical protein
LKRVVHLVLWLMLVSLMPVAGRTQAPPRVVDPAQVKADLKRILESPEFQPAKEQPGVMSRFSQWIDTKWQAFLAWLRKLFNRDTGPETERREGSDSNILAALVVPTIFALLLAAVVWLLALLIRHFAQNWRGTPTARAKTTATFDIDEASADMLEEPDEWLRQAQRFAEAQDYRRAFRAVFLGILLQLDKAGAIEYNRSRTNGDYVRLLRGRGFAVLFEAFRPLVYEFDLRWYGDRPTAEADYQRCRREYDRIRQLLAAPAPTAALPIPGRA